MKPDISTAIAETQGVTRDFHGGGGVVHALRGIDLRIEPGEFVALRGRSGSGKTTLLNILIGLDNPTQGRVIILGEDLARLSETERARLRRESIGMMFQNAHLFPSLTAQENIEVPLRLARLDPTQRTQKSKRALEMVGLGPRAHHRGFCDRARHCAVTARHRPPIANRAVSGYPRCYNSGIFGPRLADPGWAHCRDSDRLNLLLLAHFRSYAPAQRRSEGQSLPTTKNAKVPGDAP